MSEIETTSEKKWSPRYQTAYWACSHIAEDIRRGAFKASDKGLEEIAKLLLEAANRAYEGEIRGIVSKHNCRIDNTYLDVWKHEGVKVK